MCLEKEETHRAGKESIVFILLSGSSSRTGCSILQNVLEVSKVSTKSEKCTMSVHRECVLKSRRQAICK